MSVDRHIPDEQLVDFLLRDSSDSGQIRDHLDACATCAARSESIAETLRIFSADPAPLADVERNWRALRPHLQPHGSVVKRTFGLRGWHVPSLAAGMAVAILLALGSWRLGHLHSPAISIANVQPSQPLPDADSGRNTAAQLADAERLLTALNHLSGPLDPETRAQARALLLRNAVYIRSAKAQGEPGEAIVLENLGRVLTSIEAAPPTAHSTARFQTEWNIAGLLLELRILQQDRLAHHPRQIEEYQ